MLNIPLFNQNNDPLPDGQPDPFATTDCGSECISMICAAYGIGGNVGITAGDIRVIIRHGDINGQGITSADDIVYGLHAVGNIPSHIRNVNAAISQLEIKRAITAKLPTILLGNWISTSLLHWMIAVDYDNTGFTVNDPWDGTRRVLTYGDFNRLYAGTYVHVDKVLP